MRTIIWIFLTVVLLIPCYSNAGVIAPARVRLVEGESLFRTPDSPEWLPVSVNTPLDEGDAVWCPQGSRMEIQLSDGSLVRLDGGSQLDLLANEEAFAHLHLASGRLYLKSAATSRSNSLQIDADDTTVVPAGRTRLRLDMLPNSEEDVSIFKGSAYVEGNGSRTKVRAGEQIALEDGRKELLPLNPPDPWEMWNMERDRLLAKASKSESYLPDELRNYTTELDAAGTWVNVPVYGTVWRPSTFVSSDWAPYRSGRWVWKGNDFVWISFETWGWVPYHYGRWAFVSTFGWCWVPPSRGDVFWGPGYVGWYRTADYVGWTPLAPGEIFYGYGNFGRYSVNVSTRFILQKPVVHINRQARGGFVVVPQKDFLTGGKPLRQPPSGLAVSAISYGAPRIKPLPETRVPVVNRQPVMIAAPRAEHRDSRELRPRYPRLSLTPDPRRQVSQAATPAAPAAPDRQGPAAKQLPGRPVAGVDIPVTPPAPVPKDYRKQKGSGAALPDNPQATPTAPRPAATQPTPERAVQQPARPANAIRPAEAKERKIWRVREPDERPHQVNRPEVRPGTREEKQKGKKEKERQEK